MPGGVVDQAGVRFAPSTTALIEEHNAIRVGIEESSRAIVAASTWPAVYEHDWLTLGVAAFFKVDLMLRRYAQHALAVRLDGWVKRSKSAWLWLAFTGTGDHATR
jgi:hypothetical protein